MSDKPKKKKYRVNLPKTPFPMRASLATREPERLKQWQETGLENRLKAKGAKSSEKFILHDGPPYANGHIHIGHALNKTLKDIIVKMQTMQDKSTRYVPGWDCHGLPIEHALFKEMGKTKDEVDQTEFRKSARKYAQKYVDIQREEFKRLGILGEWDNPYLTMNHNYQTSIARAFYELYDKGYIYRGEKPVYWSIGCETALAEAELEYNDKTSKAIFVCFPLEESLNLATALGCDASLKASLMIWTTTPWTLPANVGVAVHADLIYGAYLVDEKEIIIFATCLADRIEKTCGFESLKLLKEFSGAELQKEVATYQHPFLDRQGKVILADYVSVTDGTGLVHIAPGHGEDDYVYGHLQNNLPIVSPVNHKGQFIEDFHPELPVKGLNVFKANDTIIEFLTSKGFLKAVTDHQHSYPFCWRSKTPVIVRSTPQWFLKVDHKNLRKNLLAEIESPEKTAWIPDWGKNRILSMVESRPDWCLSRQRLWGVPIPVAYDEAGEVVLDDTFKARVLELFEQEGADAWFSRPKEDFFPDSPEKAKDLIFETDILDVWFDSGVSHQAVLDYGHELGYPSDLYLEGSDQHRGWFQTSMLTAMGLKGASPFKQVLTHGFVMDGAGKKMSKSMGNVVSPQDVMKKYGADILRLWVSSVDTHHDVRMSPEILERMAEAYRKIRNTFRYLLGNLAGFDPKTEQVPFEKMESIDRWALSRLQEVAKEVSSAYSDYRFHKIYQIIYDFCITDLSSFYLDTLKDRLYCDHPDDAKRKSAQSALYLIAKALCQLSAPILVFTSEEVWESFDFGHEQSVHESNWDTTLWGDYDAEAIEKWNSIRAIRKHTDAVIEHMREAKEVGSSLDCEITLQSSNEDLQSFITNQLEDLEFGLIVSGIKLGEGTENVELEMPSSDGADKTFPLSLSVVATTTEKCNRCWKHTGDVGTSNPELCERCHNVESSLPEETPA